MRFRVYRTSDDTSWGSSAPGPPCEGCEAGEMKHEEREHPWTGEHQTRDYVAYYVDLESLEDLMEFIGGIKDHGWDGGPAIIMWGDRTIEIYDDRREE